VLGPQQVTRGGPILMVQVENEYGFYGKDAEYMGDLRQALLDAGFDVPLFACNPGDHLRDGYRSDLFPVVNFGSDPAGNFRRLRAILPTGPLMCGEFYPGWFDTWGAPHHTGNTQRYLADLEYMLKAGASFSIYMAHGGTTFGFGTGADRPFKPDTSSYDYDAPISEAGWTTDKFFKTRELFAKYLLPGETIPEPPQKNPLISIAPVEVKEFAAIFSNRPNVPPGTKLGSFEQYDQAYGLMLYRMAVGPGPERTLEAKAVHDIAQILCDGKRVGFMDRRNRSFKVRLPATKDAEGTTVDILVEAMGRVNFGAEVHDRKGLFGPVTLNDGKKSTEVTDWQVVPLPLDDERLLTGLRFSDARPDGPAFYRAIVTIEQPGDTFLDMRPWGKGFAWVNGHNLGRYWNIGPQQTMYVPGPWLKSGKNEIIILDLLGPEKPVIAALDKPIIDQLRPELDFSRVKRPAVTLQLDSVKPVHVASFAPGSETQEVKFAQPAKGRYFCLESLNAQDGKAFAAVAELDLLDESGKPLSHEGWLIGFVDSEERTQEDGTAENAIDGQTANFWHTEWSATQPAHPHRLMLDLGQSRTISGIRYVPRQGGGNVGGRIKDYRIYVGDGLIRK
jgi:beta-galactosidase